MSWIFVETSNRGRSLAFLRTVTANVHLTLSLIRFQQVRHGDSTMDWRYGLLDHDTELRSNDDKAKSPPVNASCNVYAKICSYT